MDFNTTQSLIPCIYTVDMGLSAKSAAFSYGTVCPEAPLPIVSCGEEKGKVQMKRCGLKKDKREALRLPQARLHTQDTRDSLRAAQKPSQVTWEA